MLECSITLQNQNSSELIKFSHLDSSVKIWFQYLLSSIPVIVKAFHEIAIDNPPVFLSNQNSFTNWEKKNPIQETPRSIHILNPNYIFFIKKTNKEQRETFETPFKGFLLQSLA